MEVDDDLAYIPYGLQPIYVFGEENFTNKYGTRENVLHLKHWIANAVTNVMPRSLAGIDGSNFRRSEIESQFGDPEKFLRRLRSEVRIQAPVD